MTEVQYIWLEILTNPGKVFKQENTAEKSFENPVKFYLATILRVPRDLEGTKYT